MSEITRNEAIRIVEDIRTAISAGSVTNTMEAQVLEYCVVVLGRSIEEASQSGSIVNLPDVVAFLAGISSSTTLRELLSDITGKIPSEASSANKLADKAFVTTAINGLQNALNNINANIGNGYVYAGIATPSVTPVSGKVFYLARQAGQYTNFGGLTVTEGINILKRNGSAWSQEQLMSMADIRKNLLESGECLEMFGVINRRDTVTTGSGNRTFLPDYELMTIPKRFLFVVNGKTTSYFGKTISIILTYSDNTTETLNIANDGKYLLKEGTPGIKKIKAYMRSGASEDGYIDYSIYCNDVVDSYLNTARMLRSFDFVNTNGSSIIWSDGSEGTIIQKLYNDDETAITDLTVSNTKYNAKVVQPTITYDSEGVATNYPDVVIKVLN